MLKRRWFGGEDFRSGRHESRVGIELRTKKVSKVDCLFQIFREICSRQSQGKVTGSNLWKRGGGRFDLAMRREKVPCLFGSGRSLSQVRSHHKVFMSSTSACYRDSDLLRFTYGKLTLTSRSMAKKIQELLNVISERSSMEIFENSYIRSLPAVTVQISIMPCHKSRSE